MRKTIFPIIMLLLFCVGLCGCSDDNKRYFDIKESKHISIEQNEDTYLNNISQAIVGIESVNSLNTNIGSGVCLKSGGYVVTNYHVVYDNSNINLYLYNGSVCSAIVVYSNPDMDIAIIKADYPIPYIDMGNSDNLNIGDEVYAVGCPVSLNFNHTFTKGIVSYIGRDVKVTLVDSDIGRLYGLIQHDASINSGNSGGPLINSSGKVVGINTLKISNAEGLGFAIPINVIKNIVDNLKV